MKKCPVCESISDDAVSMCDKCGYDFEERVIKGEDRLHIYRDDLHRSKRWVEEVQLKRRVKRIQVESKVGWSVRDTAKLFQEWPSTMSTDIRLAEGLDKYPELRKCKNRAEAKRRLVELEQTKEGRRRFAFESELELQQYLDVNWRRIPLLDDWDKVSNSLDGKYSTGDVGEMDFLARHRRESRWMVIELKIARSSDVTVGQILRYMGWVKKNLADEDDAVEGLIISESMGKDVEYALVCIPDIALRLYRSQGDDLVFKTQDEVIVSDWLEEATPEEAKELVSQLKAMADSQGKSPNSV